MKVVYRLAQACPQDCHGVKGSNPTQRRRAVWIVEWSYDDKPWKVLDKTARTAQDIKDERARWEVGNRGFWLGKLEDIDNQEWCPDRTRRGMEKLKGMHVIFGGMVIV
jgi:hypothetical protein